MKIFALETYIKYSYIVALAAIVISILAWVSELSGMVYVCPYCRVQRTVIGILGIILISPFSYHWIARFMSMVIGTFGVVVAANQHFMGWKKISAGTFQFNDNIVIDPFLLSGLALAGIIGLIYLILFSDKRQELD
ncbi:disulfide bond formation protein B [Pseudoteredinibacter isoporae]|uniref:Disulfide bond formation protein B n=1 Tax=Pseudoteredinibacter isoporae TaxID=570281 RepID=A0A7X0JU58_9GAMM|nr:disulfide bond formation protein B [Pseudoteredinibacter isoporae]MBB6521500.1 hypothetical protein [Pseudoteredinibacter isoporae]NHO87054.1 hypothetical protein [Pseudoteredinibacter isoporae]NIB22801.1 hypothetical protein [Pseudoteredinibacter isoporae]